MWSEVRVPTVAEEAARQVSRERTALTQEQTRLVNQMRGWLATWGAALPRRRRARLVDAACAIGRARRCRPNVQARLARAEARLAGLDGADRGARGAASRQAVTAAAPTSAVRQLVQLKGVATTERVGVARRRAGVARVPESAADWRAPGLCADARTTAASRSASKGSVARAMRGCKRSAFSWPGIGCGGNRQSALTQWYQAQFGTGQTRAPDRDRRGRAQAGDRAVAVCHDRRGARGRDPESRVGSSPARATNGEEDAVEAISTGVTPPVATSWFVVVCSVSPLDLWPPQLPCPSSWPHLRIVSSRCHPCSSSPHSTRKAARPTSSAACSRRGASA